MGWNRVRKPRIHSVARQRVMGNSVFGHDRRHVRAMRDASQIQREERCGRCDCLRAAICIGHNRLGDTVHPGPMAKLVHVRRL